MPRDKALSFSPKPDVTRYRRAPIIIAIILFMCVVVFLIFHLASKQKQMQEAVIDNTKTTSIPKQSHEAWYNDPKYEETRILPLERNDRIEPVALHVDQQKDILLEEIEKEEGKIELELMRLQGKARIEEEQAMYDAMKVPAVVPIQHHINTISSSNQNLESSVNTERAQLLGQLSPSVNLDQNRQIEKNAFLTSGVTEGDYLGNLKYAALSPFEVKAGTTIPAALITGLNSDLPGSVIAQVTENVYDTQTGNHVLIPQGSKLVGSYDSQVSFGQNRALVVWQRILFPNGDSINIEKMQGVDIAGYAGFRDQVDHHYGRIYGNALLISLVGAGYALLRNDQNIENTDEDTIAASVGQGLAQVTTEMARKNLNIQPTIKIRAGYKFNVLVMKDIILDNL